MGWPPERVSSSASRIAPRWKPRGGLFTGSLLGSAEHQVVIEEFLEGDEISFLCLTDGKHVAPLVPAQDHKRIGEGDTGPNTGGMGVYSTDTMLDPAMTEWILHHIAQPTVQGMAEEDTPFTGVLYCGLMMTARGPQVLEFNARFGDPETQAILMRLDSDLVEALEACVEGRLADTEIALEPGRISMRGRKFGRLSGILQDRTSHQRAGVGGSRSWRRSIPRRNIAAWMAGWRRQGAGCWESLPLRHRSGKPSTGPTRRWPKSTFRGMYYRRDIGHRALSPVRE